MPVYDPDSYPDREGGGGGGGGNNDYYIPTGKHIARVTEHELGETSGGHGQLVVTFEDRKGRTRKAWLIYEGKAGFQLKGLLGACVHHGPLDLDSGVAVRRAIYGKDVELVVVDEEYQGKMNAKIKYVNAVKGGSARTDREEPPPPREEPPPSVDDDIPF